MEVQHNGMSSRDKCLSTEFTEEPLFSAFMSITDDSMGIAILAVRFNCQDIFFHEGVPIRKQRFLLRAGWDAL